MGKVKLGIDNIDKYLNIFEGKRVGLITNPTGVNSEFKSTIDIMDEKTNLKALFGAEHGIRGDIQAGEKVENYKDDKTGITVCSLYGSSKKPTYEMLKDIDILAFDIQDVGARFYTYLYTMAYAMQSAAEFNIKFVVFDRPNPLNGIDVEGNILDFEYKSFIGLYPITQRYGLTIGELAKLFNEEFKILCDLIVVPMENWNRNMYYHETGLPFIWPSPNMPTLETALVYTGTAIFEGTNISEGRGTTKPFETIGAPWLDAYKLSDAMNELGIEGVYFRPVCFTPTFSKQQGLLCKGVQLHVTDRKVFKPVKTGVSLFYKIRELSGGNLEITPPYSKNGKNFIDYCTGNSYVRKNKYDLNTVLEMWQKEALEFNNIKKKYEIY